MTAPLDVNDIRHLGWSDAEFAGFEWVNEGRDLLLYLRHATAPVHQLLCTWAHSLSVDLDWTRKVSLGTDSLRRQGCLLTWDTAFTELENGEWEIRLDFAGDGDLSLRCGGVTGRPPSVPAVP